MKEKQERRRRKLLKKLMSHAKSKVSYATVAQSDGIVIKPNKDASDAEIHMRNNFAHLASS